jgi:tetratricopeptide (TPR) repeat protein
MSRHQESWEDLQGVLRAAEGYLRVIAAMQLPFEASISIEQQALAKSRLLVDDLNLPARSLPVAEPVHDDATDEILHFAAQPQAPAAQPPTKIPLDEGPDESVSLESPSDEVERHFDPAKLVQIEDHADSTEDHPSDGPIDFDSLVQVDEPEQPAPKGKFPTPAATPAKPADDFSHLIQTDDDVSVADDLGDIDDVVDLGTDEAEPGLAYDDPTPTPVRRAASPPIPVAARPLPPSAPAGRGGNPEDGDVVVLEEDDDVEVTSPRVNFAAAASILKDIEHDEPSEEFPRGGHDDDESTLVSKAEDVERVVAELTRAAKAPGTAVASIDGGPKGKRPSGGREDFDLIGGDEEESVIGDLSRDFTDPGLLRDPDSDLDDPPSQDEVILMKSEGLPRTTPKATPAPAPKVATPGPLPKIVAPKGATPAPGSPRAAMPTAVKPAGAAAARTGGAAVATGPSGVSRPGAAVSAGASARASSVLGGDVPTIREGKTAKPVAAAIQISAAPQGNKAPAGKILGHEEEEELLEIGDVEDYDPEAAEGMDHDKGFSLDVEEYEEVIEEVEEEDDDHDPEAAPPPKPTTQAPRGPSANELVAQMNAARGAAEAGDNHGAIGLYGDILDASPDHLEAYVSRGRIYLDLGDFARAMSDFTAAEDLAPDSPEPQVAVGDLYFARKDYRKAIDCFNVALQLKPDHAMAFCRRGISHYYRKNYDEALQDLNKSFKLDGNIPNIQTYIAMAKKKASPAAAAKR